MLIFFSQLLERISCPLGKFIHMPLSWVSCKLFPTPMPSSLQFRLCVITKKKTKQTLPHTGWPQLWLLSRILLAGQWPSLGLCSLGVLAKEAHLALLGCQTKLGQQQVEARNWVEGLFYKYSRGAMHVCQGLAFPLEIDPIQKCAFKMHFVGLLSSLFHFSLLPIKLWPIWYKTAEQNSLKIEFFFQAPLPPPELISKRLLSILIKTKLIVSQWEVSELAFYCITKAIEVCFWSESSQSLRDFV